MPKNLEETAAVATAFQKLTRSSIPVKVLRNPGELARIRAEIERFKKAKRARTESSILALFRREPANIPIQAQINALQIREAALAADLIEGELTPLTEGETWWVRAEFAKLQILLQGQVMKAEAGNTPEGRAASVTALEMTTRHIWMAKWIEAALKRPGPDGKPVRILEDGQAKDLDPDTIAHLFAEYHSAFSLSEDELKKLQAPRPTSN